MIRRCAEPGCGYLVRWHAYCPLHRPDLARRPVQPDRWASTTPDRMPSRAELERNA